MRNFVAAILSRLLRILRRRQFPMSSEEWREVRMSFSQLGEDSIIWHLLREHRRDHGIYVDVGAYDPTRYSNTLLLHKAGWHGVNIDPNPETVALFENARPHDSNVCAAVSNLERSVDYLVYPGKATNRIVESSSDQVASVLGEVPIRRIPMTTRTLSSILSETVAPGQKIDLLNVDCEGEDLNVLESLDWARWSPWIVCVEAHGQDNRERVVQFMATRSYVLIAQMLVTFVFQRDLT